LAEGAGVKDPEGLSHELMLLMDGAFASTQVFGAVEAVNRVGDAARGILERHLPSERGTS